MILTDLSRKWAEVRFYHWCKELFQLRNNMLDVVLAIEAISQIGRDLKVINVKAIAGKFISDPYFAASLEELIVYAHMNGVSFDNIGKHIGRSKSSVARTYNREKDKVIIYPKLSIEDDQTIIDFFNQIDKFKSIGI